MPYFCLKTVIPLKLPEGEFRVVVSKFVRRVLNFIPNRADIFIIIRRKIMLQQLFNYGAIIHSFVLAIIY